MRKSSVFVSRLFTSLFLVLYIFVQPLLAIESLIPKEDSVDTSTTALQEESIPIDTEESILEEGISDPAELVKEEAVPIGEVAIEETQASVQIWNTSDGTSTTSLPVELGQTYIYPLDPAVTVRFTQLPEISSTLTISTISLTDGEVKATGAASNIAYDISTDMVDGTFEYDLTLPNEGDDNTNVVFAESRIGLLSGGTLVENNIVDNGKILNIQGLDHFTVFVVVDDDEEEGTNFSAPGWSSNPSGYEGDHKWITSSQTDKTATWTYTGTGVSNGAVFLSWTIWDDHATNATYTSTITGFGSQVVNQKEFADQENTGTNGTWSGWYRVPGEFNISTGSTVTLSPNSSTNGNLSADAVAFVDLNEVWVDDDYSNGNSGGHFWGYDAFNNIQDGVNAVASGGTVYVASGTYQENLTISKSITLKSLNGATSTIIDGSSSLESAAITISADNVIIEGFTIQDANNGFGGIHLFSSEHSEIKNNTFKNNGGDIWIEDEESDYTTITGNTLNGDYPSPINDSWGIWVSFADNNNISNNIITGKSTSYYSAIYLEYSSDNNTISGNLLTDNLTLGGIQLESSNNNEVSNNTIINNNNTPDSNGIIYGMGIYLSSSTNNTISGNTVKEQNDAIRLVNGSDNIIKSNTLTENYNGINFISSNGSVCERNIVQYNEIYNNKWTENIGRGIYFQGMPGEYTSGSNVINNNNIYGNPTAGVFYEGTNTLDATNNWWGHITGPSTVGNGLGDKVSTNVTYQQWLCAPYQENVTSIPSVNGICPLIAPVQTGYNVKNSPTDPENTPRPTNEIACTRGYTNINSVSVHWTDVSGEDSNIKYQRQYKVNNGNWGGNEIYTNTYTDYRSFGGGTGNNGIYGSQVRAFYDTNENGQYDVEEPVSGWSNECSITYDKTPPLSPKLISPEEPFYTRGVYFEQKWESREDAVKYEYNSCYNDPDEDDGSCNPKYQETFTGKDNTTKKVNAGQPDSHFWWRVRAQDLAGNWSEWSDAWEVIIDNTNPTTPTNLYFKDLDNNQDIQCNGYSNTKHVSEYWDASVDTNLDHYEYSSYNAPNGAAGLVSHPLNTNFYDTSWWLIPSEGTYGFQVRAVDKAGNKSAWALSDSPGIESSCKINIDWTKPNVDLQFNVNDHNFKAVFSENVNKVDAENQANYFLNNWPTAGGSGNLVGDASISYDSSSNTALITFTNSGWYISPEQQWGVQNVHDLAGNILAVTPYTEYSTKMLAPETTVSGIDTAWHSTNATVNLLCTDINGSGCYKTHYSLDGGATYTVGNTVIVSSDGENIIHYYSEDMAGNIETVKVSDYVKIDKSNPDLTILNPSATLPISGMFKMNGIASDSLSGIRKVTLDFGAGITQSATLGDSSWSLDVNDGVFNLLDGIYNVTVTAEDNSGNTTSAILNDLTIDNEKPTASTLGALTFTVGSTTPRLITLTDNHNLESMCYTFDGSYSCSPISGTTYLWDVSTLINSLAVGNSTFSYYVVDEAGNQSDFDVSTVGDLPYTSNITVAVATPLQQVLGTNDTNDNRFFARTIVTDEEEPEEDTTTEDNEDLLLVDTQENQDNNGEVLAEEDQQGDDEKQFPWWGYLLIAAILSFIIFILWKRRKDEKEQEY